MVWISGVRPLLMFTYWANYQLSHDPFGFHVVNVLIHIANSFLIFLIVRRLLRPESALLLPAFAGAVFLLHPVQTESVSYIAGRSESLSVFFLLAAFAVFLYRRQTVVSWRVAIAVLLLFGAALTSKEHTLVLPVLLLLTDYYWNPGFSLDGIRRNWRLYAPIALGAAGGAVLVVEVLARAPTAGFSVKGITWYQYFFTECRAFFVYLRLFVFPVGQNLDWEFPVSRTILDRGAVFGFFAILLLVGAAIYYRRRYPLASYGFLVYILLMAPTSSFVPIKDPIAERRLYLPMIGLLLVVTAVLRHVHWDRRKMTASLCAVQVVLAVLTYRRNLLWANDVAVWEDAARKSPGKARVHFQLAHTYYTDGRCLDAVAQYAETARLQKPDYALLVDWGLACDCAGEPETAIAKLRQAAALHASAHVYSQIGMVYAKQSRWQEALDALARAQQLDPKLPYTYYYRGGVFAKTGNFAAAVSNYQRALALDPSLEPARQGLIYAEGQLHKPR